MSSACAVWQEEGGGGGGCVRMWDQLVCPQGSFCEHSEVPQSVSQAGLHSAVEYFLKVCSAFPS